MARLSLNFPGGRIGNFFAGAVVASAIGGTAVAVTSPDFTYSAVRNGYYSIHPMAMTPDDASSADDYFISYNKPRLQGGGCYQTGFNLPQGASVVSVGTWYSSNAQSNPTVYLVRANLPNDTGDLLVKAVVADDSDTRKPIALAVPASLRTVDNAHFSYGYGICLGPGTVFYSARVNYTYKSAGD